MNKKKSLLKKINEIPEYVYLQDLEKNKNLRAYNNALINWDFEKELQSEFFKLLSERNVFICEKTPLVDFQPENKSIKNEAHINHEKVSSLETLAIHMAAPHQKKLYSLIDPVFNHPQNQGVFATIYLKDILHYGNFNMRPLMMAYFLDLQQIKNARVQINFEGDILSRFDLAHLYECGETMSEEKIKKEYAKANKKWIKSNTIKYNKKEISKYKKERLDYIVVESPITVIY